jgi:hypothetical protein
VIELRRSPNSMVIEQEVRLPEIPKRPLCFRHFGTSLFCEGESQTIKIAINGSIYSTNIHIRLYLYTKQKGLAPNLPKPRLNATYSKEAAQH